MKKSLIVGLFILSFFTINNQIIAQSSAVKKVEMPNTTTTTPSTDKAPDQATSPDASKMKGKGNKMNKHEGGKNKEAENAERKAKVEAKMANMTEEEKAQWKAKKDAKKADRKANGNEIEHHKNGKGDKGQMMKDSAAVKKYQAKMKNKKEKRGQKLKKEQKPVVEETKE